MHRKCSVPHRIPLILVRVQFQRQAAVGALYIRLARVARNAQRLAEINDKCYKLMHSFVCDETITAHRVQI